MTETGYKRIQAALDTLSEDEAEMILVALYWLKEGKGFSTPTYKKAQEQAVQYFAFDKEAQP